MSQDDQPSSGEITILAEDFITEMRRELDAADAYLAGLRSAGHDHGETYSRMTVSIDNLRRILASILEVQAIHLDTSVNGPTADRTRRIEELTRQLPRGAGEIHGGAR